MRFAHEDIRNMLWGADNGLALVSKEFTRHARWHVWYELVFSDPSGDLWRIDWSEPATEMQEPLEEDFEAVRVEPVETTVIKYAELS